jgi:hypothetical protein
MQAQIGCGVQPVLFLFCHFRQILLSLLHPYVAGGAGAASSTCVFEVESEVQSDIEKRFGSSMFAVGKAAGLELDGLAVIDKGDLRHNSILENLKPLPSFRYSIGSLCHPA